MSTYLVAFLVGDFKCISGESDGVPIRACATPDKVQYAQFALSAAEFVLHYYDTYFGIKYPMPKLDMIALPDFEAGAMENFGAITYRETAMLVDDKNASVGSKKNVGLVVAHEMAHQWFGDMVTMQWWDNIWLNEGFATWMENKPLAAWKPEWQIPQDVAARTERHLGPGCAADDAHDSRPGGNPGRDQRDVRRHHLRQSRRRAADGGELLGEETFRQGVHDYLKAHMYGNATAEDFWNAQTAGKPQARRQDHGELGGAAGRADADLQRTPRAARSRASQQRFFLSPSARRKRRRRGTCRSASRPNGQENACEVFSGSQQSLKTPDASFLFANAQGKGYYRSSYPADVYAKIVANVETGLTPEERISLLGDEWAQVRANKAPVGDFLDLAAAVKDDSSGTVVETALSNVATINSRIAATPEEHEALAAWVRNNFKPALERLGAPSPSDTPEKKELRATLFGALGNIGKDPEVIAQAKELANQYIADQSSVDATLAQTATAIAAINGDAAFFDKLQKIAETSPNPEVAGGRSSHAGRVQGHGTGEALA